MDDDLVPISAVEHFAYCPMQAALIHREGVWADNAHTALGSIDHAAVDRETRLVRRDGKDCWLSLPVQSIRLGVRGICDLVEITPALRPVEYKPIRSRRHLAPAEQQLAVQALCLEEMFETAVPFGSLFAGKERRRQEVAIGAELRQAAAESLEGVRQMLEAPGLPPRALDARCRRCSLRDLCLVDEAGRSIAVQPTKTFAPAPEGDW